MLNGLHGEESASELCRRERIGKMMRHSQGAQLKGENLYAVTLPDGQLPPVDGFWSIQTIR